MGIMQKGYYCTIFLISYYVKKVLTFCHTNNANGLKLTLYAQCHPKITYSTKDLIFLQTESEEISLAHKICQTDFFPGTLDNCHVT